MSYFLCGIISVASQRAAMAQFATLCGARHGLVVKTDEAVEQPMVLEVVGYSAKNLTIPFLIVSAVQADTSDDLISPYVLVGDEGDEAFRRNARKLSGVIKALMDEPDVNRIDLYVVDSVDDVYPSRTIGSEQLERALLDAWAKRHEDFFFRLIVRKLAVAPSIDTVDP